MTSRSKAVTIILKACYKATLRLWQANIYRFPSNLPFSQRSSHTQAHALRSQSTKLDQPTRLRLLSQTTLLMLSSLV
jgi:hypothetical protein